MDQELADRLATVERAVTDGETDLENVVDGAATADRVADLEARVEGLEDEVAELDAAVQAVRGYVGEIRAINEEVEETAAAAMAKADKAVGTGAEGTAGTEAERVVTPGADWSAGPGVERTTGHDHESPAATETDRAAQQDGEWSASPNAERDSGTPPAAGETGGRSRSAVRSENCSDPSTHPASAATAASRRADGRARQAHSAGACAGGGGTTRSGACPACGRAPAADAGTGPSPTRETGRSGGDRGLLDRVRDLL